MNKLLVIIVMGFIWNVSAQINLNQYDHEWSKDASVFNLLDLKSDANSNTYSLYSSSSTGVFYNASGNQTFSLTSNQKQVVLVKRDSDGIILWTKRTLLNNCDQNITGGLSYNSVSNRIGFFINYGFTTAASIVTSEGGNESKTIPSGVTIAYRSYYAVYNPAGTFLYRGETFSDGNNISNYTNVINDICIDNAGGVFLIGDAHERLNILSGATQTNYDFSGRGFYLLRISALGGFVYLKRWDIDSWYNSAGRNKKLSFNSSSGQISIYAGIYSSSNIQSADVDPNAGVVNLSTNSTGLCNGRFLTIKLTSGGNFVSHALTGISTNYIIAEERDGNRYLAVNISDVTSVTSQASENISFNSSQVSSGSPVVLVRMDNANNIARLKSFSAIDDISFNIGLNQLMLSTTLINTKEVLYLDYLTLTNQLVLSEVNHSKGHITGNNNILFLGGILSVSESFDLGFGGDIYNTLLMNGSHVSKYNRCSMSSSPSTSLTSLYYCDRANLFNTPLVVSSSSASGTFVWVDPLGTEFNNQSNLVYPSPTISNFGTYNLFVSDDKCLWSSYNMEVVYTPTHQQTINFETVCEGDSSVVWLSPPILNQEYTYQNHSGVLTNSDSLIIPNFSISDTGEYSLLVVDQNSLCPSRYTFELDIFQIIIDSVYNQNGSTVLCSSDTLYLTSQTNPNWNYNWSGPNGWTSTLQNPIVLNPVTGTYSLIVTDIITGCSNANLSSGSFINVTINPEPTLPSAGVSFNNDTLCSGQYFIAWVSQQPGFSYQWHQPNGTITNNAAVVINSVGLSNAGTYTLQITNNTTGCSSSLTNSLASFDLVVNESPNFNITSPSATCFNDSIYFSAPSNPNWSYSWTGPNGWTSNVHNPIYSANSFSGNNTFNLSVTDNTNSCITTQNIPVFVIPPPAVNWPLSGIYDTVFYCSESSLILSINGSSSYNYLWTGPNGYTSTSQSNVINPLNLTHDGIYHLIITDPVTGCQRETQRPVNVNPSPDLSFFINNETICEQQNLMVDNPTNPNWIYSWSGPNNFSSTNSDLIIVPVTIASNGNYLFSATDTLTGCVSDTIMSLLVNSLPNLSTGVLAADSIVCEGDSIELFSQATNPNWVYSWSGPNGWTSNVQNPIIFPAMPFHSGIYTVMVTDNVTGCVSDTTLDNSTLTIVVNALPVLDSFVFVGAGGTGSNIICAGGEILLNASSDNTDYFWSGPNGWTSNVQNPVISPAMTSHSGTYTVTIRDTITGCINDVTDPSASVTVFVGSLPVISDSIYTNAAGNVFCENSQIQLYGQAGNWVYSWSGPNGWTSNVQNPIINPSAVNHSGIYTLQIVDPVSGCISDSALATSSVNLTVTSIPNYSVESTSVFCLTDNVTFQVIVPAGTAVQWSGPSGFTSSSAYNEITSIMPSQTGTYTVLIDFGACEVEEFLNLVTADHCDKVPEIVTPNNDFSNDSWELDFLIKYPNNTVMIFNRWGSQVFEQPGYGPQTEFNGFANMGLGINNPSKELPNGTYFYIIDLYSDGTEVLKGYFELQK